MGSPVADGEVGHVLTQKVGPLPLVLWVVGGSGVVLLFMLMRNKGSSGAQGIQTNQITALAPTEAEAFGTIEQQQQDVTNALTTLGNNQSALGGSLSTLTGIVTQQGSTNAASFQSVLDGLGTVQQGQASANAQATSYYQAIQNSLANYFGSVGTQLGDIAGSSSASQANSLAGLQSNFKNYASSQFGYQANLGGAAGYLALPQNAADFVMFLLNPSLADPNYQKTLMNTRGYVFESQIGATSSSSQSGLTNLPIGQNTGSLGN